MSRHIEFGKVADIYDSYVIADFDIPFWLKEARTAGRVLELTSGTGRVSIPLLKSGVDLTCVDYSPEMLTVLRNKVEASGLTCSIVEVDISQMSLPIQYDLIFIPMNSFSEIVERELQMKALARIRAHLAEDGFFICTLRNPEVTVPGLDGDPSVLGPFRVDGGETLTVTCTFTLDERTGRVRGKQLYEFHDESGRLIRKRKLEISYHLFSREEFEEMTRRSGFEIVDMFGDYDYAKFIGTKSPSMIWKLKTAYR